MTNREAIKVLEWIKNTHPEHITCETIDLAVSALEKQEVDKCCETCKHKRHTAIEWPCRECYMSLCDIEDYYEPYTEEE